MSRQGARGMSRDRGARGLSRQRAYAALHESPKPCHPTGKAIRLRGNHVVTLDDTGAIAATRDPRPIHISGYDRQENDFYPTPAWVTEALLDSVTLRGPVWEPCCGDGAMARVFQQRGHEVTASDLMDRGYGRTGVDFMAAEAFPDGCQSMVTNPPYGDGGGSAKGVQVPGALLGFTRHAIKLTEQADGQLALLVRFQWLAGRKAATLISAGPLSKIVVLRRRIRWFDMGPLTNHGQHHHAWLFWDAHHKAGRPPEMVFAG